MRTMMGDEGLGIDDLKGVSQCVGGDGSRGRLWDIFIFFWRFFFCSCAWRKGCEWGRWSSLCRLTWYNMYFLRAAIIKREQLFCFSK